ncbi:MAG: hypothetical protein Ct9H300mP21_04680 [Pseudomonadota bacterium]|nr:MAG: hypothetical protein Ct9H300mP21_04680 [Pseudomonadota bacterium]
MAKAELYKITINDGKVMLRIPQQLVGAETARWMIFRQNFT